ncbi:MAG: winged helix DNA-binding protein [Sphingomicrobium sp.]
MTKGDRIKPADQGRRLRLDVYLHAGDGDGADTLSRLVRLADDPPRPDPSLSEDQLVSLACRVYRSRRLRANYLSASMLGEPVWDMLLALYCCTGRGEQLSVSGLCYSAGVPQTTALRWVQIMEQKELIERRADQKDARRALLTLTPKAKALLSTYLASIYSELKE